MKNIDHRVQNEVYFHLIGSNKPKWFSIDRRTGFLDANISAILLDDISEEMKLSYKAYPTHEKNIKELDIQQQRKKKHGMGNFEKVKL